MPIVRSRLRRRNISSSKNVLHALDTCQRVGCTYSRSNLKKIFHRYVEDKTATSCFKNDAYEINNSARSTFLVALSPDCTKSASTNGDHTVKIFDTWSGELLQTLKGHPRTPWCISFHPVNSNIVASGCLGGQVRVWDLWTGVSEVFVPSQGSVIASLSFHPIDNIMAIATGNKLLLWKWDTREILSKLETGSAQETVRFVKFHPLGNWMMTAITNNPERPCEPTYLEVTTRGNPHSGNHIVQTVSCLRMEGSAQPSSSTRTRVSATESSSERFSLSNGTPIVAFVNPSTNQQLTVTDDSSSESQEAAQNTSPVNSDVEHLRNQANETISSRTIVEPQVCETIANRTFIEPEVSASVANRTFIEPQVSETVANRTFIETQVSETIANRTFIEPQVSETVANRTFIEPQISEAITNRTFIEPQVREAITNRTFMEPQVSETITNRTFIDPQVSETIENRTFIEPQVSEAVANRALIEPRVNEETTNRTFIEPQVRETITNRAFIGPAASARVSFSDDGTMDIDLTSSADEAENLQFVASEEDGRPDSILSNPILVEDTDDASDDTTNHTVDAFHLPGGTERRRTAQTSSFLNSDATNEQQNGGSASRTDTPSLFTQPRRLSSAKSTVTIRSVGTPGQDSGSTQHNDSSSMSEGQPSHTVAHQPFRSEMWTVNFGPGESESEASLDNRFSISRSNRPPQLSENPDISVEGSSNNIPVFSFVSYPHTGGSYSSSVSNLDRTESHAVATATARTSHHVHTAVVITRRNNEESQIALRTAINRAIAGAFAGSGEGAVASNIINTTHRLQLWDMNAINLLDLRNHNANIVVPACKVHNDGSLDVSKDGTLVATFVPSQRGFPDDGRLCVFSLKPENIGQCLYRRSYGPNAISVSLSPLNRYILVGLASRRLHWQITSKQLMAQVLKLSDHFDGTEEDMSKAIFSVVHPCNARQRSHISVNTAKFHPEPGCGIIYGTNRGHVQHCRIGRRSINEKPQWD